MSQAAKSPTHSTLYLQRNLKQQTPPLLGRVTNLVLSPAPGPSSVTPHCCLLFGTGPHVVRVHVDLIGLVLHREGGPEPPLAYSRSARRGRPLTELVLCQGGGPEPPQPYSPDTRHSQHPWSAEPTSLHPVNSNPAPHSRHGALPSRSRNGSSGGIQPTANIPSGIGRPSGFADTAPPIPQHGPTRPCGP